MMAVAQAKETRINDKSTISYYDTRAREYVEGTFETDVRALYKRFLKYIPDGGVILDAGSGSGRDTLAFKSLGYVVEAFDASTNLASISSNLTGTQTKVMTFQEFSDDRKYDGIWACASLLHIPMRQMHQSLEKLVSAIRVGGVIYMSFKYGSSERALPDGRHYTDLNERKLRILLERFPSIKINELWISEGEGEFAGRGRWLNCIVERTLP